MNDETEVDIRKLLKRVKKLEIKLNRSNDDKDRLEGIKEKDQIFIKKLRSEIDKAMNLIELRNKELSKLYADLSTEMEKSDKLLLNILPVRIANDLKEKGETSPESFDNVTVFFSDIVGFTKISSGLSPTVLIEELNIIFTAFDNIIEINDCERIKTIGDAYMAVSGMPNPNENHAVNLVSSAIQIIKYLRERNETSEIEWKVRIGLHSGSVVGGIVGVKKYIYDVFGDTVNSASRMESNSEVMKINISETTYELVKNNFNFIERPALDVKGKGKMKMWFVEV